MFSDFGSMQTIWEAMPSQGSCGVTPETHDHLHSENNIFAVYPLSRGE
jgi:hypothetical protein